MNDKKLIALKKNDLLNKLCDDLPDICQHFFIGNENNLMITTRIAYAYDLIIFFNYLTSEVEGYIGKKKDEFTYDDIDKITPRILENYLSYLTIYFVEDKNNEGSKDIIQENTEYGKSRKLYSVRAFLKYMYKQEYISANVGELVSMPAIKNKPIMRLEIDEVSKMLDLIETGDKLTPGQKKYHNKTKIRDLALISLFLGTGIRVSECVGIDIDDMDFNINGFLVTRKGGEQEILYFSDEIRSALLNYYNERIEIDACPGHENALFLSMQKKRITARAVENMVKKYSQIIVPLKKKFSPHKLRSTFATNLYNETEDINLVANLLGHKDINTTRKHYAALSDEKKRYAARNIILRGEKKE